MGLEYIVQPQVFLGGLTALGPGIQGLTENYPLLTTYNSWTSTAPINASVFPMPGTWSIYDGPNNSASFIVSVGGVIQPPSTYSIDILNRLLTFSSPVSADIEIAVTQLATASPSSQDFNFVKSVSAEFTTLSANNGTINTLIVTNLTALSTVVNIIDVQVSEVSGFRSTGDVQVDGNVTVGGNLFLSGNLSIPVLSVPNATFTNLTAANGIFDTSSSTASLRVTQRGSGNAIEIEDSTNPDSTPFVVTNTGTVLVGLSSTVSDFQGTVQSVGNIPFAPSFLALSNNDPNNWARIDLRNQSIPEPAILLLNSLSSFGIRNNSPQGTILFSLSTTEYMRINSNGNVGIHTAFPASDLTVSGSFATSFPVVVTSTSYTVPASATSIIHNAGGATYTLPAAATYPGQWLYIKTLSAVVINSATANVTPLTSNNPLVTILPQTGVVASGRWTKLQSNGTHWVTVAAG
jgi:hypothetical protein